jgi:predicted MPP superfamily phosphohydrolase
VEPLLPELRELTAPLGVFAVLGNHEYYAGPDRSREVLQHAGWTVLDNRAVEVAPGVVIAGVPDARGAAQTGAEPADLGATLDGVDPAAAIVLLQHSPGDEQAAADAGVDLMLNGHTHGGQIWPFHHLVALAYPKYAGVHRVGGMTQVVSRGAGYWGPPMRLLAPADVVLVTLGSGADPVPDEDPG